MNATKNIIIYKTADGKISFAVQLAQDTVWLTQLQMAELFATSRENITMHLRNIFQEKELCENSVCKNFLLTAKDGKKYQTKHYNLDAILSVGYRINTKRGTEFRVWATKVLREHLLKGYTINEKKYLEPSTQVNINHSVVYIDTINYQDSAVITDELKEELAHCFLRLAELVQDSHLREIITEYKKRVKDIDKHKSTFRRIQNFIIDVGDPQSAIHKLLYGSGVAKKVLLNIFKVGMSVMSKIL